MEIDRRMDGVLCFFVPVVKMVASCCILCLSSRLGYVLSACIESRDGQQAMDPQISIVTNRGSEMGIDGRGQTEILRLVWSQWRSRGLASCTEWPLS